MTVESSAKKRSIAGYVLTGLVAAFLTFDTVMKLLRLAPAVQGTTELGYPAGTVVAIGAIELVCLVLYLDTAHVGARCARADWISWRCDCDSREGWKPAPDSHALPDLRGPHGVGRTVSAREPFARVAPVSNVNERQFPTPKIPTPKIPEFGSWELEFGS